MGAVGPGEMVKNLVLGCVQSWLNRFGREDIVKMVSDNFIDKEIFDGLKCLCECLGLDPPKSRRNTMKQVAVKVWAAEMYDIMMKEDNSEKLPEFVVSSQELQRVPLALLSGANDVVPICTKMNLLEKKMEDMVDTVTKLANGQVMSSGQVPLVAPGVYPGEGGSYANIVQGATGINGVNSLPSTPVRPRVGSFGGAGVKRKLGENVNTGNTTPAGPNVQIEAGKVAGQSGAAKGQDGPPRDQNRQQRTQRKQCFGTSKISATSGKADWAAPVEVFISNTSPDITEEDVKEILKMCADDVKSAEGNEHLSEFNVKNVKCLTRPDIENPRTKCWRVSVPFQYKEYILSDIAYPMGWSHRPFYPPKQKSKEEMDSEQQAKRTKQTTM